MTRGVPAFLVAAAAFALVPLALPGWATFLLTLAVAKSVVVLAIALLLRGGLVSFGHGMFFATGAYTAGLAMRWLGDPALRPIGEEIATKTLEEAGLRAGADHHRQAQIIRRRHSNRAIECDP